MTRAGIDLNTGERFNPVAGLREGQFQQAVYNLARANDWRVAHFRPVKVQRRDGSTYHETPIALDGRGWPDLVLVRGSQCLIRELKDDHGEAEPEQLDWLERLGAAGLDVAIWRPSDWHLIEAVLAGEGYRTRIELAEGLLDAAVPLTATAIGEDPRARAWLHLWQQRRAEPFAYTRTRRRRAAARPSATPRRARNA